MSKTTLYNLVLNHCSNPEVAQEIFDQADICVDMCRPLTKELILYLCTLSNVIQVSNALHSHKFA